MKVEILQQNGCNFLWIDLELWMWDIPAEVLIQKEIAEQASGDVLIAGYGLGVVHRFLKINEAVTSITTIEKYPEVIDEYRKMRELEFMTRREEHVIGKVIIGDFLNCHLNKKFDYVIGDIWPEIIPDALSLYVSFKEKATSFLKRNGKILAWGQDYFEYLIDKETR